MQVISLTHHTIGNISPIERWTCYLLKASVCRNEEMCIAVIFTVQILDEFTNFIHSWPFVYTPSCICVFDKTSFCISPHASSLSYVFVFILHVFRCEVIALYWRNEKLFGSITASAALISTHFKPGMPNKSSSAHTKITSPG